jgi:hypothetical protein
MLFGVLSAAKHVLAPASGVSLTPGSKDERFSVLIFGLCRLITGRTASQSRKVSTRIIARGPIFFAPEAARLDFCVDCGAPTISEQSRLFDLVCERTYLCACALRSASGRARSAWSSRRQPNCVGPLTASEIRKRLDKVDGIGHGIGQRQMMMFNCCVS